MEGQLKRCTGAIWPGHLSEDTTEYDLDDFFDHMIVVVEKDPRFLGGAFALERGEKDGNLHIQYYLEHKPMRLRTIGQALGLAGGDAISKVRHSAKGAYDYCGGFGEYYEKEAIRRHVFGEVKLWGSGIGQKSDLAGCVEFIMNGNNPYQLLKENPYAYAVHRRRIWDLYLDLTELARTHPGGLPTDFEDRKNINKP